MARNAPRFTSRHRFITYGLVAWGAAPSFSALRLALRPRLGPIPRAGCSKRVVAKPIEPVIIRERYTAT